MNEHTSNVDIELKKIKNRIEFLFDVDKLELVVEEAKNLLSIDPEDKYGLYMLAQAYKNLNRIDEAETVILEYLKRYEDNPCGHVLYARVLQEKDNYKQAREEFQRAIDLDPDNEANYINLAINLMIEDNKNLPRCIELAEKAVSIAPTNGINHSYLGELYFVEKRLYDAEREALKGLELNPQQHMVHDEYARIQYAFGNIDVAKKHFEELFHINPNHQTNQKWLEDINYFKENMEEYLEDRIKYLLSAAKAFPKDKKVHLLLSKTYFRMKKKKNALAELEKHLLLNPENADIEMDLVHLLIEQVNQKEITFYFDKLTTQNPENENIQAYIDYIYENPHFKTKIKKNKGNKMIYLCLVFITIILLIKISKYL